MRHNISGFPVARVLIAAAIAAALACAMATAALASGTSPSVHGCYAKWGHTGTSGYCEPATATGKYRVFVDCRNEPKDRRSRWVTIANGSKLEHWGQVNCTFGIHYARIEFTT
jgi:hypothetical protein